MGAKKLRARSAAMTATASPARIARHLMVGAGRRVEIIDE
jgi:hypothetical protein